LPLSTLLSRGGVAVNVSADVFAGKLPMSVKFYLNSTLGSFPTEITSETLTATPTQLRIVDSDKFAPSGANLH